VPPSAPVTPEQQAQQAIAREDALAQMAPVPEEALGKGLRLSGADKTAYEIKALSPFMRQRQLERRGGLFTGGGKNTPFIGRSFRG